MDAEHALDECGCAPSESEARRLWPGVTRRSALGFGALGALSLAAVGTFAGPLALPAFAATYPTWDDVVAAQNNEALKAQEVARIQALIQALADDLAAKQAAAELAAAEFYEAQQAYFDAAFKADQLQKEADAQAATAADAADKAGRVAAQLYRNGGDDTALELFFSGSAANADDLLARLGTMDKLIERNQDVYATAVTARDAAQNLSDQAAVAREERDRLQKIAEDKMIASQKAADAAQAALDAQQAHLGELEAQLAALRDTTAKTIADYQAGVEAARIAREQELARQRAEAERLAREAAASGGGGGGGGGGGSSSGWVRPSWGGRTSGYGPRTVRCGSGFCASGYHYGVDMAAGCGAGIVAAAAGVVVYAGYNGGYGNYIKIDHGGGIGTGYAHIRPGGIFVGRGQWVGAGQLIASEGNTGNSLGCHLHFETYVNGFPTNPSNFMAARGIWL